MDLLDEEENDESGVFSLYPLTKIEDIWENQEYTKFIKENYTEMDNIVLLGKECEIYINKYTDSVYEMFVINKNDSIFEVRTIEMYVMQIFFYVTPENFIVLKHFKVQDGSWKYFYAFCKEYLLKRNNGIISNHVLVTNENKIYQNMLERKEFNFYICNIDNKETIYINSKDELENYYRKDYDYCKYRYVLVDREKDFVCDFNLKENEQIKHDLLENTAFIEKLKDEKDIWFYRDFFKKRVKEKPEHVTYYVSKTENKLYYFVENSFLSEMDYVIEDNKLFIQNIKLNPVIINAESIQGFLIDVMREFDVQECIIEKYQSYKHILYLGSVRYKRLIVLTVSDDKNEMNIKLKTREEMIEKW